MKASVLISIALATCFQCPCFSQAVGSKAAYNQVTSSQQRAEEARMAFERAKKITRISPVPLSVTQSPETVRLDPESLKVGKTGKLDYWKTTVLKVIDDRNTVVSCAKSLIWLADYPTKDFVTDEEVRIIDYVQVGEPKDYNGFRMSSIALVSIEDNEKLAATEAKIVAEQKQAAEKAKSAKLRDFRTWKSKTGDEVKGKFIRLRSTTVELELENGKKNTFRITALTDEDAELVRKLAQEDSDAKKASK